MIDKKFCLFDQDEQALFEFDNLTEFSAQVIKIAVDEKRRGAFYLLAFADSRGFHYFGGVYETHRKAAREIKKLRKYLRKMQNQQGRFGFKFANDVEGSPLLLMEILNAEKFIEEEEQRLDSAISKLPKKCVQVRQVWCDET